jgi:hypothetical protein
MLKIIKTQNGDLINFANLIEIGLAEGEGINERKETVTMFALIAVDTLGKDRELGLFDTQSQSEKVSNLLEYFLAFSTEVIFDVPDNPDDLEDSNV